ncbi:RNA polymerase subunit RPO147 [Carp edema virus]|nr:RNA polymerase subunit RPO147 [Carp edema virus]
MRDIVAIKFGVYTNEEIAKVNINITAHKVNSDYETVKDKRLGAIDNNICNTCKQIETQCYGHWGKLDIQTCVVRPTFYNHVISISKFICLYCGVIKNKQAYDPKFVSMLINQPDKKETKEAVRKLAKLIIEKKTGQCWNENCEQKFIKINFNKKRCGYSYKKVINADSKIDADYPKAKLFELLSNIPKHYWPLLGIKTDPADFFYVKYFPIPPLLIRPPSSFWLDDVKKETNELTILLTDIVKASKNTNDDTILQKSIIEYDNVKILSNGTKQNVVSLNSIIVGKNNMLRSYVLAGRKEQTFRSVVGPGADLKLWEIGVSDYMRKKLSQKIYVNPFTIKQIVDLFYDNKVKLYYNSLQKTLVNIKKGIKINGRVNFKLGDWVETDVDEYCHIIFGRQPSLHKHNVVSSCARKSKGYTLKVPQVICNSQNADFDGDEEWGIIQQHPKAVVEQSVLMFPVNVILHDLLGVPAYGSIQDEIISGYLLSKEESLTVNQVNYILKNVTDIKATENKNYSGKDVISMLINLNKNDITFRNILKKGQLVASHLTSDLIVGQKMGSLAKLIIENSTRLEGAKFINNLSFTLRQYLKYNMFGVLYRDLCPDYNFVRTLNNINIEKLNQIKKSLQDYKNDFMSGKIMRLDPFSEEEKIDSLLNNLVVKNIQIITNFMKEQISKQPDNSLLIMSEVGYKMNPTEIMYIMGTFGMQKIGGKKMGLSINKRILPYFLPDTLDPDSYGFVMNPLLIGLTGTEYYFLMAVARSQIVDVVCETSRTGSLGRKIIKKMEDIISNEYGQTVCNKVLLSNATNIYKITKQDATRLPIILPNKKQYWYDEISYLWKKIRNGFFPENSFRFTKFTSFMMDVELFLETNLIEEGEEVLGADILYRAINNFTDSISLKYFFTMTNLDSFKYNLYTYLDPNRVKISKNILEKFFNKIESRLTFSLSAGYPIGIIFAQTLSEKFTQQALSSFHTTAKSGGMAVKLGFDEFLKITNLSGKGKPETIVCISEDRSKLEILKSNFQFVCLDYLKPEVEIEDYENGLKFKLKFDRRFLIREAITIPQLEIMIEKFVSTNKLVNKWSYRTELISNTKFEIDLLIELNQPIRKNKVYFPMLLYGGIYKGKISPHKFNIEEFTVYTKNVIEKDGKSELEKKTKYKLVIEIDNITMLTNFDLTDVEINPGIWTVYNALGITSAQLKICDAMLSTYGNGFDYLYPCCDLLSSLMCQNHTPESINNFKFSKISVMKKCTFNDHKSIGIAAMNEVEDPVEDNSSSHFTGQAATTGTGFFKYFMDINPFRNLKEMEEEIENNEIEKLLEEF